MSLPERASCWRTNIMIGCSKKLAVLKSASAPVVRATLNRQVASYPSIQMSHNTTLCLQLAPQKASSQTMAASAKRRRCKDTRNSTASCNRCFTSWEKIQAGRRPRRPRSHLLREVCTAMSSWSLRRRAIASVSCLSRPLFSKHVIGTSECKRRMKRSERKCRRRKVEMIKVYHPNRYVTMIMPLDKNTRHRNFRRKRERLSSHFTRRRMESNSKRWILKKCLCITEASQSSSLLGHPILSRIALKTRPIILAWSSCQATRPKRRKTRAAFSPTLLTMTIVLRPSKPYRQWRPNFWTYLRFNRHVRWTHTSAYGIKIAKRATSWQIYVRMQRLMLTTFWSPALSQDSFSKH